LFESSGFELVAVLEAPQLYHEKNIADVAFLDFG
jgi:hypothetical protein